jgi:hypothetical protein
LDGIVAGPFAIKSVDRRFEGLFLRAVGRVPPGIPPITAVSAVVLSGRRSGKTVGLTRYTPEGDDGALRPKQTLTFYSSLLDSLSGPAALAVIAHELAHAWLNEHRGPEESPEREQEADDLARRWGFSKELEALDREAETLN